jgi:RNA polymerase sigma factor for flagellar operon FliA
VQVDDLQSAGVFGLMDALDTYDVTRGIRFETYSAIRIRGAIYDELRSLDWVPRLVRNRARRLQRFAELFEIESGRKPTVEELAHHLSLTKREIKRITRSSKPAVMISLSAPRGSGDDDVFSLEQIVDERSDDPIRRSHRRSVQEAITRGLTRGQRLLVNLYYYEQMSMAEIGKILDLSESRVSQMHAEILERLKQERQTRAQHLVA